MDGRLLCFTPVYHIKLTGAESNRPLPVLARSPAVIPPSCTTAARALLSWQSSHMIRPSPPTGCAGFCICFHPFFLHFRSLLRHNFYDHSSNSPLDTPAYCYRLLWIVCIFVFLLFCCLNQDIPSRTAQDCRPEEIPRMTFRNREEHMPARYFHFSMFASFIVLLAYTTDYGPLPVPPLYGDHNVRLP